MLPLTRNIFRQTAKNLSTTPQSGENRKSYYIQVKCGGSLKNFTCVHRENKEREVGECSRRGRPRWKGWTFDDFGGGEFSTEPMMLRLESKRFSLLFHFKAFFSFSVTSHRKIKNKKALKSDQICRDATRVFLRGNARMFFFLLRGGGYLLVLT